MIANKPTPVQEAIAVSISVLAFFGGAAYGIRCVIAAVSLIIEFAKGLF